MPWNIFISSFVAIFAIIIIGQILLNVFSRKGE